MRLKMKLVLVVFLVAWLSPSVAAEPFSVNPEQLIWTADPAAPGLEKSVLVGDPAEAGPFVKRVRLAAGAIFKPHTHPEDRVYTVLSGTLYIGWGDKFDDSQLRAYPAGSILVVPGGASHFHAAVSGEWVAQINSMGPTWMRYVDSADDPQKK